MFPGIYYYLFQTFKVWNKFELACRIVSYTLIPRDHIKKKKNVLDIELKLPMQCVLFEKNVNMYGINFDKVYRLTSCI